ncbi:hypothetical protein HGB13_02025 [bacterium]|nr:hypothetical protein [bacterium]
MRRLFIVFIFLLALFFEVSIFSRLGFVGIYPNIMLMFLVSTFFILPELWVFIMTLSGYLVLGLFTPIVWGALAVPVFLIFIILYLIHKYIFTNINLIVIFLMGVIASIFYNLSVLLFYFLWGQRIDFVFFLKTSFFMNILVNGIFAILWFYFINSFWENFLKRESYSRLLR